jgi:membrane associated rhomboid family serine protease
LINESVLAIQYYRVVSHISPEVIQEVLDNGLRYTIEHKAYVDPLASELQSLLYTPTVGASGAIFGVLLAIGVLFPNMPLMIFPLPIPIRAKFFVIGYAVVELFLAVSQPGSSIAHAAHLGGMIFGYILIRYWRKTSKTLY